MSTTNVNYPTQIANALNNTGHQTPGEGLGAKPAGIPQMGWVVTPGVVLAPPAPDAAQPVAAEQAAAPPAETPETCQPTTENKEQLHRRVQTRLVELEAAQAQLAGQDGNQERAQALETELQVARASMSGGWEHVGQMEAAQLSQWLAKTENLTLAKPVETSAPQA